MGSDESRGAHAATEPTKRGTSQGPGESQSTIAKSFNVDRATISRLARA
jgi:hypothetical protein